MLDADLEDTRLQIGLLDGRVASAIEDVLKTDPAVAALLDRYHAANQVVVDLAYCLQAVSRARGIPAAHRYWDVPGARTYPDCGIAAAWQAAIQMLADNATAALPE